MKTALVKIAPIFTLERINDPAWNRAGRTLYEPGALMFLPAKGSCPLIVDHEGDLEIGTVHDLFKMDWTDGPWICARATVSAPPCWLKRGTRASFGFSAIRRREFVLPDTEADIMAKALVNEVSVLSASKQPKEPRAEVLLLQDSPASGSTTSDRASSPARVQEAREPRFRDALDDYGFRDGGDLEAFIAKKTRSPLDRLYDEHIAAKRAEPQVLVRHGVGQVLGAR